MKSFVRIVACAMLCAGAIHVTTANSGSPGIPVSDADAAKLCGGACGGADYVLCIGIGGNTAPCPGGYESGGSAYPNKEPNGSDHMYCATADDDGNAVCSSGGGSGLKDCVE